MAAPMEVLLTSEVSGHLFNICVWDPQSATQLATLKGGSSASRTLCLLRQDYIMTAVCNRPLLHIWSLHRKDQVQQRMVLPGQVTALATSPNGQYCVAGIEEKIHVWQVSTGNLLAVISRHYQTINCIRFTDDGSHFISGGEDNLVLVWSLSRVLSEPDNQGLEPRHIWAKHSLPVTDVHVGHGAAYSRVISASLDQTVRMWDLSSGEQLCTFIFDHPILSTTMDNAEMRLFAGSSNGNIYQIDMFERPTRLERHISADDESRIFTGHSKQVTCLSVSMDGTTLVSGSQDATVRLWDIASRQCVRSITHKGPITNVDFILTPQKLLRHDNSKTVCVAPKPFKRYLHGSQRMSQEQGDNVTEETISVLIPAREAKVNLSEISKELDRECIEQLKQQVDSGEPPSSYQEEELLPSSATQPELKRINKDIYQFAVNKILSPTPNGT